MKIEVNHLTRVEGHAHLVVDATGGELRECRLEIVESPRFFEALLKGRPWPEVAPIISRVCGVCSNSHTIVSLAATEAALGVEVSRQTRDLRRLLLYGEILQSHLLHLYFMTVPDYLGVASLFPLAKSRRELVSRALRLKRLANRLCEVVGGRPVHPVTPCVGGFASLPQASELKGLRQELVEALPDLEATVELFASFDIPDYGRQTNYMSLSGDEGYPSLGQTLCSTDGLRVPAGQYRQVLQEYLVPHSTAKFVRANSDSFMVGPLARLKNGHRHLSPMAARVMAALKLDPATTNPYRITMARLVEVIHFVEEAMHLIDGLLLDGMEPETLDIPDGGGSGAAAAEAPRGTLYHSYSYDEQGRIEAADCVIPTAQNLGNIEADLKGMLPGIIDQSPEEVRRQAEMLIRAYDPCISCSTHLVKVDFV